MVVTSKVVSMTSSKKEDKMFVPQQGFTFEDLIRWVYRNCPGDRKIIIEHNCIEVQYSERVEIYYLREEI